MLRRNLMRLIGGAAVAPAVARAAKRADMVAGRVPLGGAIRPADILLTSSPTAC